MAVPDHKERISITLPKDLVAIIKQDAKGNKRPLSKEITSIVFRHYIESGRYSRPDNHKN